MTDTPTTSKPGDDTAMKCARALSADMDSHRKAMENVSPKQAYGLGRAARVIRGVLVAVESEAKAAAKAKAKASKQTALQIDASAKETAEKPPAKRDPIFDALACASKYDLKGITKPAAGRIAKAKSDIVAVCPDVTPAEIMRRAAKLAAKYPAPVTPTSISAHWAEFGDAPASTKPALPKAPVGWLATLNRIWPDCAFAKGGVTEITEESDYQWSILSAVIRRQVEKEGA